MKKVYVNNIEWIIEEKDGKYIVTDDLGSKYVLDTIQEVKRLITFTERITVPFSIIC